MSTKFETKIGYNSACVRDISEIFVPIIGDFRGWATKWCQTNFTTIDPCYCGNEIWDKIGNNSACVRDKSEILAYNRGFSWSSYRMMSDKFHYDRPLLPWQRDFRQNRL